MKVLGRIRLSRLTDESTSAARQRELIEGWAKLHDHTVVGWAEDLDVSGSVDPFEAPALGPWLARPDEWDILVAWKLDRVGRRAIPLNKLFGWMIDNQKTLVCVSDNIDLSTWVGRLVANVIAGVAEGELEAIRERTKASRKKLLETGRWPGGSAPYGLMAVPLEGGGWRLELDPETAPVVRRIVAEVTAGSPVAAVKDGLNADGIPAPKGGVWRVKSVWHLLTAKYLLGHATYDGQTVRDSAGKPVCNATPLLTQGEWDRLQDAVSARRITKMRSRNTSPLLGVITCLACDKPLHHRVHTKDGKTYRYYYCEAKHGTVNAEAVEQIVYDSFLDSARDINVTALVYRAGESHAEELAEALRAVDELSSLLGVVGSTSMRSRLTEQMRALDGRILALEQTESRPGGWEQIETGGTYGEAWENADTEERRQLLLQSGIRFKIHRVPGTQAITSELYRPENIQTLLNTKIPPTQRNG